MNIYDHPDWSLVRPYVTARRALHDKGQPRLEFRGAPPAVREVALLMRGPCPRCGHEIAYFKYRNTKSSSIYLGISCTYDERPGCGRSTPGRNAAAALYAVLSA